MKHKISIKQPTPRSSRNLVARYLEEVIDYGGEPFTRGEAILDMQRLGCTRGAIDRWFQGYELGERLRATMKRTRDSRYDSGPAQGMGRG